VLALLLQAFGVAEALEYRRVALAAEPWRLLTGHLVHLNWQHATVNAVALLIVARLFAHDLRADRQAFVLVLSGLVIGAGMSWLNPGIAWYRGLSGVIHALFFAGAAAWLVNARPRTPRSLWLPAALFFGGWIKVALEQPGGDTLPHAEWLGAAVVPQAHLIGAACGSVLGLAHALADAWRDKKRTEQKELQPR
jgi:rhomboid family GlyGly-CTERM serine protease